MSPLSLIGQSTHKSKFSLSVISLILSSLLCTYGIFIFFLISYFTDRLPFSLPRNNGHRVEESKPAMFDRWRTILQFYYKQRRRGYHGGGRYDRGLTYGYSKYLSYSTVKVRFVLLRN